MITGSSGWTSTQCHGWTARSASTLSRARYDGGVTSYLEVLDTERTLFSVQLELSELTQLYLDSYVNLYKALGGGWITREEMEREMEGRPPEAAAAGSSVGCSPSRSSWRSPVAPHSSWVPSSS